MTRECSVCGDELPTTDLAEINDGRAYPECHGALFVDEKPSSLRSQRELSIRQLTRAANEDDRLDRITRRPRSAAATASDAKAGYPR